MPEEQTAQTSALSDVPLALRIKLSHAYFQHLANRYDIDILHVKGYAFAQEVYRAGRNSTDVDLLVRPEHIEKLVQVAQNDGWEIIARFETGSIFEHAMTLYHGSWGLVDIHRYFPGIGDSEGSAFEMLWQQKRTREIAHYPCYLPSLTDSRIFVVVHGARSENKYNADIEHLRKTLSPAEWQEMRDRLPELDAELAFAAALHELDNFTDHPDYLLWKSVSEKTSTYIRWKARFVHAKGFKAKMRVVFSIILVNKDHLAMELGHPPTHEEVRQKFFSRFFTWKKK